MLCTVLRVQTMKNNLSRRKIEINRAEGSFEARYHGWFLRNGEPVAIIELRDGKVIYEPFHTIKFIDGK